MTTVRQVWQSDCTKQMNNNKTEILWQLNNNQKIAKQMSFSCHRKSWWFKIIISITLANTIMYTTSLKSKLYMSSIALRDDIFLKKHNNSEWDMKFHFKILKHLSYLSCLKICFKICLCDNTCFDLTFLIFLILNNINIIFVKKIIKMNLVHCSDLNFIDCCKNKILKHVCFNCLWNILIVYNLKIDIANLFVTELYDENILDELKTEFNMLCMIFKNFKIVKLIAQSHILNCVITNLMMVFEIEKESSFLNV